MKLMPSAAMLPLAPAKQPAEQSSNFLGFLPLREIFSLDLRSLALLRVGLGIVLVIDWLDRLPELAALYSDAGIVPRYYPDAEGAIRNVITGIQPISIHMFGGAVWFQAVLAGIAILFALLLVVGWRTPFVAFISWFLLISVHARNPAVMQGGDILLRMLLFWGIFLPLGACYSIDSPRLRPDPRPRPRPRPDPRPGGEPGQPFGGAANRVLSAASVAYIVQICLVYWFAASWKWDPVWRTDGTGVYLSLRAEYFTTRFAHFLLGHPEALRYLSFATLWLEVLGPTILFFPFAVGLQRVLVVSAFILFHVGLGISLELSNFPWVCCMAWAALLPSSFWDRIQNQLRSDEADGLTIYHDASRGRAPLACLRTFLMLGGARLAPGQEAPALLPRLRREGGWAVVDAKGEAHYGLEALVLLVRLSPIFSPLTGLFRFAVFRWLGVRLVRLLAGTVFLGRPVEEDRAVPTWAPPGGMIANTLIVFCLIYVVLWNIRTYSMGVADSQSTPSEKVEDKTLWLFPNQASQLGLVLGLEQSWALFAPRPGMYVGWHLVIGTRLDGSEVDLLNDGGPVDRVNRPKLLAATYRNGRWRKMMMNLTAVTAFPYLPHGFARYFFQTWNAAHDGAQQLRSVDVVWMREETRPYGVPRPPVQFVPLYHYEPGAEKK